MPNDLAESHESRLALQLVRDNKGAPRPAARQAVQITQQFQIVEEKDDTIIGRPYDGADMYGDEVEIAKAPGLAAVDYDGITDDEGWLYTKVDENTRTAFNAALASTEIHKITPDYMSKINSRIFAMREIRGWDEELEETPWIDCNLAGRIFAQDTTGS